MPIHAERVRSLRARQAVDHPYTGVAGPGFPDGNRGTNANTPESRQAFATFGGPHILSWVTEVATRCLKAVRRQKFNYHRRARPERIGGLLTLKGTEGTANDQSSALGTSTSAPDPGWFTNAQNYLLPMAFAEGSPMHPSYGAGHATVAGGCVTMLKAFFNTTDTDGTSRPWPTELPVVEANSDGCALNDAPNRIGMTINGELNKLAANISICRNMAGVHYYTDYYESLRMGERIATGMLIEQMKHYNEPVEFSFESFDGDHIHILKNDFDSADPRVFVHAMVDGTLVDIGLDA